MKKILVAFALLFTLSSISFAQETSTTNEKNCTVEKCKTDQNTTCCEVCDKEDCTKCSIDKKSCSSSCKHDKCTKEKTDKKAPTWATSSESSMTKPSCCKGKKKEDTKKEDVKEEEPTMKCAAGKCGGGKCGGK